MNNITLTNGDIVRLVAPEGALTINGKLIADKDITLIQVYEKCIHINGTLEQPKEFLKTIETPLLFVIFCVGIALLIKKLTEK